MHVFNKRLLAIHTEVKIFSEHWLRMISYMARCLMLQYTAKQIFIRTPARMQHGFTNRILPSILTPGQTFLSPRQQQYPDRKKVDLKTSCNPS
jgi:hypothetical protein